MTSDSADHRPAPWPRFTRPPQARPVREPSTGDPWPRWGWFPREQRTWTFAPGPGLAVDPASPRRATLPPPEAREARAPIDVGATAEATLASEAPPEPPLSEAEPVSPEPAADVEAELLPARRPVTMALVPVGLGEVTLGEVARAVRRAAPAAAVAGAAALAAVAFFRRR